MLKGYVHTTGDKELFLISNSKMVTKDIVNRFIDERARLYNISAEAVALMKKNKEVIRDIKSKISSATLEKFDNGNSICYNLSGGGFSVCYTENKMQDLIILK